jgi:DNA mismatch repair protein MLH1
LVESSKIKRAIEGLYTAFLPKGASPFVYLSLTIDPAKVDVNVHPTKSEVHFLHEDDVVDAIVAAVDKALSGANTSRSFTVQTMLPGAEALTQRTESSKAGASMSQRPRVAPNYKVRMDPANRTLDSMVAIVNPSQLTAYDERPTKRRGVTDDTIELLDEEDTPMWSAAADEKDKPKDIPESICDFTSIQDMRRAVRKNASQGELFTSTGCSANVRTRRKLFQTCLCRRG